MSVTIGVSIVPGQTALMRIPRGAVDDGATAFRAHLAKLVLHAGPDAAQVDRGDAVEALGWFVGGVGEREHDPGVVERHVKLAELGDGAIHQRRDLILVGHVAGHADRTVSGGGQLVGRSAQCVLVDVGEHDGRAGRGERAGGVQVARSVGSAAETRSRLPSFGCAARARAS